jgi:hypothetical protein
LNRKHHGPRGPDRRGKRRHRDVVRPERREHEPITLNDEGYPAANGDAPKLSPAVFVSDESRAKYPWLPPRVIAGSVWRGPSHERVRVDETGSAAPWRCGPATGR